MQRRATLLPLLLCRQGAAPDRDGRAFAYWRVGAAGIANHPAAQFCVNLSIGGFTDWHLPSRLELDIAYFNLKPSTQANTTSWGANSYSVPVRAANYIENYPARTGLPLFTSSEAFADATHWSSTENSSANGWGVGFINGLQAGLSKTSALRVRAFRRVAL